MDSASGSKTLSVKRVHDELDAITAAYVGLCWLQDAYEAAGPPDEMQIILPLPSP